MLITHVAFVTQTRKNTRIHSKVRTIITNLRCLSQHLFWLNYLITIIYIYRIFMKINPQSGAKREPQSKRRHKSYDSVVFKLAQALSKFSDDFKLDM